MSLSPYFSVMMPLYNHEAFVGAAVRSVLEQSFSDYELIICDDGSTDDSFGVVSQFNDDRIRIIRRENGGTTSALNSCLLASRGRYVCWLSSDDIFLPSKLKVHHEFHSREGSAEISIAPYGWIVNDTVVPRAQKIPLPSLRLFEFLEGSYVNGLSVCANRNLYVQRGGFNQCFRYAQDTEQWFALFRRYRPVYLSGPPQSLSRKGSSSLPSSSTLGHLDGVRIFLNTLVHHGFEGFIPEKCSDLISKAEVVDRLLDICASPNNYFVRFGLAEIFWSGVKSYAGKHIEFKSAMDHILSEPLSDKRRIKSALAESFDDFWQSDKPLIKVNSEHVLGLYLKILNGIEDLQTRRVCAEYFSKIL